MDNIKYCCKELEQSVKVNTITIFLDCFYIRCEPDIMDDGDGFHDDMSGEEEIRFCPFCGEKLTKILTSCSPDHIQQRSLCMIMQFYDARMSMKICEEITINSFSEAPLVGDSIVLVCSKEYEEVYGYDNRSGNVQSRLIDYRDNSISIFIK